MVIKKTFWASSNPNPCTPYRPMYMCHDQSVPLAQTGQDWLIHNSGRWFQMTLLVGDVQSGMRKVAVLSSFMVSRSLKGQSWSFNQRTNHKFSLVMRCRESSRPGYIIGSQPGDFRCGSKRNCDNNYNYYSTKVTWQVQCLRLPVVKPLG